MNNTPFFIADGEALVAVSGSAEAAAAAAAPAEAAPAAQEKRRRMIEELRAGAKIVFAGGIVGTIAEATEKTFVVETTDGKMEILRSCVQGVLGAEAAK